MIVMDLVLEGSNSGLRLLRVLKSRADAPSITAHTTYNSEEDVFLSRQAGADSFVYKGEETAKLMEA
jgi:DNA-binding NarL/FixJ family response regulator